MACAPTRPRVFLLSTTHGPETAGLAAYLAVQEAYAERDVVGEMERQGRKLADAVNAEVAAAGLEQYVEVTGRPSCLVFADPRRRGAPVAGVSGRCSCRRCSAAASWDSRS